MSDCGIVTINNLGEYGRLGNQLFQYAAGKSLALHNNCELVLSADLENKTWHGQQCLLNNFNLEYRTGSVNLSTFYEKAETYLNFDPNFFSQKNVNLDGYFQCELYFKNYENQIRKEFTIKNESNYLGLLEEIKTKHPTSQIIGLHMRRGDDIEVNQRTFLNDVSENSYLSSYLNKCFQYLSKPNDTEDKVILIFTGGSRFTNKNTNDMEWCKEVLKPALSKYKIPIYFSELPLYSEDKYIALTDFVLMKNCHHLIITNVSSYSWWAGYLNQYTNKSILVPKEIPHHQDLSSYWADSFIKL